MHGDAAFIGQGIVPETFNMSQVKAYFAGGTVHIVTNNQIGFTTSVKDSRSTVYCTDPYKGFDVPVFHVNAEDVDAACWLIELAAEYRQKFNKDVIVDLICWRKLGHNEGDDPTFTQPVEYSEIKAKKHISETYFETILNRGLVDSSELELQRTTFKTHFAKQQEEVVPFDVTKYKPKSRLNEEIQTQVGVADLKIVAEKLIAFPNGFTPHPKVKQLLEKRVQSLTQEKGIDWGFAETLAFGTLLKSGKHIRLVGQDAERATFSHRHLNIKDINVQGSTFAPLSLLSAPLLESNGASFEVYNSTLSENAATAYEYGYSLEAKDDLVLWEAQFGDFANGAQVIIDQFIASSEVKWKQTSGIVFLLPHGYEGQGPEHSSARLERFLQLCAEGNMRVCYPSNGAQYFHLLRDQGLRKEKRPLIVMTPKSLLRLHEAGSSIDELTNDSFKPIIETNFVDPKSSNKTASSAIICSGKVYYDLLAEINAKNIKDIKVIRVEQLYPFPSEAIHRVLKSIDRGSVKWVQEEPMNMGAWTFVEPKLRAILGYAVEYVGRPEAASTAEGSLKYHAVEQRRIITEALG